MYIEQRQWTARTGWQPPLSQSTNSTIQLVFVFAATAILQEASCLQELRVYYPYSQIIGCSTAGEIYGTQVLDDSLIITAVHFEYTRLKTAKTTIRPDLSSFAAGEKISQALLEPDLRHLIVFSDGIRVNGSELVRGLLQQLPANVSVTGGLAGDGNRFEQTLVYCNGEASPNQIVGLGLYGTRLQIGYGSLGGWDPFGPERLITRSADNVLYELDGRSALALYKQYLGSYSADLPASGLLFPLSLRTKRAFKLAE